MKFCYLKEEYKVKGIRAQSSGLYMSFLPVSEKMPWSHRQKTRSLYRQVTRPSFPEKMSIISVLIFRTTPGICKGMWDEIVSGTVQGGSYPLCYNLLDLLQMTGIYNNVVSRKFLIHPRLGEMNRIRLSGFSKCLGYIICSVFPYCVNYTFQCS